MTMRVALLLPFLGLARVVDGGITVEDPTGKIVERKDMGDPNLPPVMLIPGIGGSRIQARARSALAVAR